MHIKSRNNREPKLFGKFVFLVLICIFALQGCQPDEPMVYQAPKDPKPSLPVASSAPSSHRSVSWAYLPSGWKEEKSDGMRQAAFSIEKSGSRKTEVTLVSLPGESGGLAANVNRWRGQVGLGPLSDKDAERCVSSLQAGKVTYQWVALQGKDANGDVAIVSAMTTIHAQTWFIKLMGPVAVVHEQEPAFKKFLAGLTFEVPHE